MGKEYTFMIKYIGTNDSTAHEETMSIEGNDPIAWVEQTLKTFNSSLRPYEKPRAFVKLKSEEGTGKIGCNFSKKNAMTRGKGYDTYDVMECNGCGLMLKRGGVSKVGTDQCRPDTTCNECNKAFKTKGGYDKHMIKDKHRQPEWCI